MGALRSLFTGGGLGKPAGGGVPPIPTARPTGLYRGAEAVPRPRPSIAAPAGPTGGAELPVEIPRPRPDDLPYNDRRGGYVPSTEEDLKGVPTYPPSGRTTERGMAEGTRRAPAARVTRASQDEPAEKGLAPPAKRKSATQSKILKKVNPEAEKKRQKKVAARKEERERQAAKKKKDREEAEKRARERVAREAGNLPPYLRAR